MPTLRRYRGADWDAFIALELEVVKLGMRGVDAAALARVDAEVPGRLREAFEWDEDTGPKARGSELLVLDADDGAFAGHLWLTDRTEYFLGGQQLHITSVAVVEACRGRGWGRLLVERAIERATERGLELHLGVAAWNEAARALYRKLGFREVKVAMTRATSS